MNHPENDMLLTCVVCGKQWERHETDKYYYHDSIGTVCAHHHGVKGWYDELIEIADKESAFEERLIKSYISGRENRLKQRKMEIQNEKNS